MLIYMRKLVLGLVLLSGYLVAMEDASKIILEGSQEQIVQLLACGYDGNKRIALRGSQRPLACIAAERGHVEVIIIVKNLCIKRMFA